MRTFRTHLLKIVSLALFSSSVFAETLSQYVDTCKEDLGFTSIPQFSCNSEQFRTRFNGDYLGLDFSQSDDFVGHKRVNNSVDAVFACRWVGVNNSNRAVSGEMIVHNRRTGGTCFFELKDTFENNAYPQVSFNPPSPTASNASQFWASPSNTATCTDCHAGGPYIASPQIVGALAKFGLINDGHDIRNKIYYAAGSSSSFADRLNDGIDNATQPFCSKACHTLGGTPIVNSRIGAGFVFGAVVLPSINHVIDDVLNIGAMPPTNNAYSDYRWLNRDDPGSTGDHETVADFKSDKANKISDYSAFYCDNPRLMQARRVDSGVIFSSSSSLRTFNLQDGLVCVNADFPSNDPFKCLDYQTRYKCDGEWTGWQSTDKPTGDQDNESRSRFKNLCSNPTDIQARHIVPIAGAPWSDPIYGARDRFSQFDNKGFVCKNSDQADGSCSNYSVRFICN